MTWRTPPQTYPGAIWPAQITDALRGLIHAANLARDAGLAAVPAHTASPLSTAYRTAPPGLPAGLARSGASPAPITASTGGRLLEVLRDREDDVLRFVADLRIPPTSNQAERDLRPAKTQEKISGRLSSEQTTRHRYAIRGYLSTASKHGADVLTALRDAIIGHPGCPPSQPSPDHPRQHQLAASPPEHSQHRGPECLHRNDPKTPTPQRRSSAAADSARKIDLP